MTSTDSTRAPISPSGVPAFVIALLGPWVLILLPTAILVIGLIMPVVAYFVKGPGDYFKDLGQFWKRGPEHRWQGALVAGTILSLMVGWNVIILRLLFKYFTVLGLRSMFGTFVVGAVVMAVNVVLSMFPYQYLVERAFSLTREIGQAMNDPQRPVLGPLMRIAGLLPTAAGVAAGIVALSTNGISIAILTAIG